MRRAQLAPRGNAPSAAATMRAARCPCHHAPGPSGQVQAKVRVGPVDDPLEREADRAADAVLAGATAPHLGSLQAALQRKCATCEQEEQQTLRRQADMEEEDEELQMKAEAGGAAPAGGHAAAAALGSAGQPLPSALRGYFEPRFGHDFSAVRLHTDAAAASGAAAINARAFTLGRDIAFAQGEYTPESRDGRRLLAHELAHVVQQARSSSPTIQREALHFYDFTDNALRRGGYAAHYCEDYSYIAGRCVKDKSGMLHAGIDEIGDIEPYVRLFRGRGHAIDSMYFHTHGAPGYIHLPSGGITARSVWSLNSISSEISSGATIGFLGCNVGEGSAGNRFLLNAGSSLLMSGGGTVYASDSVTFSVPGIGQRRPIWSSIKTVCVDSGGSSRIC